MNRAGGRGGGRRGRRNGVPTWQACAATVVVAVACTSRKLLTFVMKFKDADEAVRWAANIIKRTLTDEFPSGDRWVYFDPTKWLFILPLVLLCLAVGCYIGYTFRRAMENAEETVQRLFGFRWHAVRVPVNRFLNAEDIAIEVAEVEG